MNFPQWGLDRQDAVMAGFDTGWWDIRCAASVAVQSSLSGRLVVPKMLKGTAVQVSSAQGQLTVPKLLGASAVSAPTSVATLSVPKILSGTAWDSATATTRLSVPKLLAALVENTCRTDAALVVPKSLAGVARMQGSTTAELTSVVWPQGVDGYVELITSQHIVRPRFVTMVKALTAPLSAMQETLWELAQSFDVDSAVGVQLDQVGEWVGVRRVLRMGLQGVYFSLDTEGVGFDEGVWKGRFDPDTELVRLPDDQYRTLIRARIAANHWDGTIPGAYAVWRGIFTDSVIFIQDWQNMSMTVGIAGLPLNAVLRALLTDGYIPLKPEGVRVDYYAVGTIAGPLLGFDTDSAALAGFDVGQWAVELQPRNN